MYLEINEVTIENRLNSRPVWLEKVFAISLLVILTVVLFGPMSYQMIYQEEGGGSYRNSLNTAMRMVETESVLGPHFLYQLFTIGLHFINPAIDFYMAGLIVSVLCYIFLSILIYWLIRPILGNWPSYKASLMSVLITLSLMMVTPITFFTWFNDNYVRGYLYNGNFYNSSSTIAVKPFVLLLFLYAIKVFSDQLGHNTKTTVFAAATMVVFSTLTKPSYIICLLPALALLSIYRYYKKQPINWQLLILGIFAPAIVVLGWQYYFIYTGNVPNSGSNGIIFAPLAVFGRVSSWLLPKFILSILFPLSIYIIYFEKARKDFYLNMTWLVFLFGAFYTYFLAESGPRFSHGNFAWSGQLTSFILFVVSTLFFLRQNLKAMTGQNVRYFTWKYMLGIIVFSLHLISGIPWYYFNLIRLPPQDFW